MSAYHGFDIIGCNSAMFDIVDFAKTKEFILSHKPDIIIHCAAATDVERCETQRDYAYAVNVIGTANLTSASLLLKNEPFFCYISSAGVYGSHKTEPYCEFDEASPTTVHHDSKLQAEKIVASHIRKSIVVRAGWLYGGDISQPKNFVYKRYLEAKDKAVIYANNAQKGNPTFVGDFVKQVIRLIEEGRVGIYNCANNENATRYEYVKAIVESFGLDCKVEIADKSSFMRIANVSDNESVVNYKLKLMGVDIMPQWRESLEHYVLSLKRSLYGA